MKNLFKIIATFKTFRMNPNPNSQNSLNSPNSLNKKGIALPMVIGLVTLLMLASVAANEMVIRALRSVHFIEAADKAYFAAEAGIEDALYELSPHFAGYETPDLENANVRNSDFGGTLAWENKWTIRSHKDTDPKNIITGKIYQDQKLILSLFNDESGNIKKDTGVINEDTVSIEKLAITNSNITFKIPEYIYTDNPSAFSSGVLVIDNDGDLLSTTNGYNEDGKVGFKGPSSDYVSNMVCESLPGEDDDCDGRENEDSPEDPVIYWKITDDNGKSLVPKTGCLADDGSEICEKDFQSSSNPGYSVSLTSSTAGINQDGEERSISNFLTTCQNKCQMEFLIVAPLEQVDASRPIRKISIPYLEYGLDITTNNGNVPLPYFTIKSDGYYKDFKQSITTTLMPKTAVPLFDFTIIQQQ